jgi:hypothetical protein
MACGGSLGRVKMEVVTKQDLQGGQEWEIEFSQEVSALVNHA